MHKSLHAVLSPPGRSDRRRHSSSPSSDTGSRTHWDCVYRRIHHVCRDVVDSVSCGNIKAALFSIIAVAFVVRLSFISGNSIGSEDAYRYIWHGKRSKRNRVLNPYLYTAISARVSSPFPAAAGSDFFSDLKTIYFPLSQWIFYSCYQLSGEADMGIQSNPARLPRLARPLHFIFFSS